MKFGLLCLSLLMVVGCQPKKEADTAPIKTADNATLTTNSKAPICDQYAQFVEAYANKQADDVKASLMKRLEYDKQHWTQISKQESDEYCQKSLERMQKMAK